MANLRRDLAKELRWREALARHGASGLSVREFCRRESLAESAFHCWRRTIAQRDGRLAPRRRQIAAPDGQVAASRVAPAFVPAVVTHVARRASALPGGGASDGASERDGTHVRAAAITIELAGGRVLRLPESIDAARLAEVVHALETRGSR